MSVWTPEYIPVVLPCIPSHPNVEVRIHRWDWRRMSLVKNFSRGVEFDPRLGYKIDDPEDFQHNGTYLCEFTDTGKGKKFSSLVIDLLVRAKKVTKTFVKVNKLYGTYILRLPFNDS